MRTPRTVRGLEALGRVRLSPNFFMRDFLHSDIAVMHGLSNVPEDPDRAVAAGSMLCRELLEPLQRAFGRVAIRSAYRSVEVNGFGNRHGLSCAANAYARGRHTWDGWDGRGLGAMACIVVPWLVDRVAAGASWTGMAWWIHDHLHYSELQFYPKLAAFNIGWHEAPRRRITSYVAPRGLLMAPGQASAPGRHGARYPGYPEPRDAGGAA